MSFEIKGRDGEDKRTAINDIVNQLTYTCTQPVVHQTVSPLDDNIVFLTYIISTTVKGNHIPTFVVGFKNAESAEKFLNYIKQYYTTYDEGGSYKLENDGHFFRLWKKAAEKESSDKNKQTHRVFLCTGHYLSLQLQGGSLEAVLLSLDKIASAAMIDAGFGEYNFRMQPAR